LGTALFSIGGVGDMIWHIVFGIEANMEALLSPMHLLLATGAMLFITGPLRAAWVRLPVEARPSWAARLPALLSLFMVLAMLTFFTQFAHFTTYPALLVDHPADSTFLAIYFPDLYGTTSALIPAAVIMGMVLLGLRRWDLPRGFLTLLLMANTAMMWVMKFNRAGDYWALLVAAFAAGLVADLLLAWLKPSAARLWGLRMFAFSVPFTLILFNHLVLIATAGMWWTIHMWMGVPFMAGVAGLLLSFVAYPPATPDERI
jgi:hypothetical protein